MKTYPLPETNVGLSFIETREEKEHRRTVEENDNLVKALRDFQDDAQDRENHISNLRAQIVELTEALRELVDLIDSPPIGQAKRRAHAVIAKAVVQR